jgi:hypothetical protein
MIRKECLLLALALAGPGCISPMTPPVQEQRKEAPIQAAGTPPPPIVSPDEVTEANASEKAQALARELDFAANEPPAVLPGAPAKESVSKP